MELVNQLVWEDIFAKENGAVHFATARAKVKGGWLVSHSINFRHSVGTGTCFLPDKNHEWEL